MDYKLLTIIGARPQFVKASVVSKALLDIGIEETIVHTGQHYDSRMSNIFWEQLGIPKPSFNLSVGSLPHGAQTALIMQGLEELILDKQTPLPDAILVYGDTNSTIAGALVAAKLNIPVIHVEAGLRSFNRAMPEEINRVVTDHLSSLLFCSSEGSVLQLQKEGIIENVHVVGDVMLDAFRTYSKLIESTDYISKYRDKVGDKFILLTIHRPSNTDSIDSLTQILNAINELSIPVIWPVHPRNRSILSTLDLPQNLYLFEPASYLEMLSLLKYCDKVITDSGGLQKESYWAKKACVTVREETEWVETLEGGWNRLTGANTLDIIEALALLPKSEWKPLYGDGEASIKIAHHISSTNF